MLVAAVWAMCAMAAQSERSDEAGEVSAVWEAAYQRAVDQLERAADEHDEIAIR
jgi:hypothetical protein